MSEKITQISSRLDRNGEALNNIRERGDRLSEVETKWIWVKALSNTANGNISGKEKIMLETYIQMTYLIASSPGRIQDLWLCPVDNMSSSAE